MRRVLRERARLELERVVRAYRRARLHARPPEGWLRAMRLAVGCDLVYGLVPWERSLEDRALELVEREVWRKRYTAAMRGWRS